MVSRGGRLRRAPGAQGYAAVEAAVARLRTAVVADHVRKVVKRGYCQAAEPPACGRLVAVAHDVLAFGAAHWASRLPSVVLGSGALSQPDLAATLGLSRRRVSHLLNA